MCVIVCLCGLYYENKTKFGFIYEDLNNMISSMFRDVFKREKNDEVELIFMNF